MRSTERGIKSSRAESPRTFHYLTPISLYSTCPWCRPAASTAQDYQTIQSHNTASTFASRVRSCHICMNNWRKNTSWGERSSMCVEQLKAQIIKSGQGLELMNPRFCIIHGIYTHFTVTKHFFLSQKTPVTQFFLVTLLEVFIENVRDPSKIFRYVGSPMNTNFSMVAWDFNRTRHPARGHLNGVLTVSFYSQKKSLDYKLIPSAQVLNLQNMDCFL